MKDPAPPEPAPAPIGSRLIQDRERLAVRIRDARPSDLPSVVEVEAAAYSVPWNYASLRALVRREGVRFLVAQLPEPEGRFVGHGILRWAADEGEIVNLAVVPEVRGRGVGSDLLDHLLEFARDSALRSVFLEVRASNDPAIALYRSRGFRQVGVREHYYDHPREDARILRLDLSSPPLRPPEESALASRAGAPMTELPTYRGRRLRGSERLRALVRETRLSPGQLLLPLFVEGGRGVRTLIPSMPGVARTSVDEAVKDAREAFELGLGGVLLFGIPENKDEQGTGAWKADGIVQRAVRDLKGKLPDLLVVTDVCLCEYTTHGHCGVLDGETVLNDPTLDLLARTAVSHAEAGADMVAPSDMMDGRVGAIRAALDGAGFVELPILSYAAKYASAFYGPFRDAADSAPAFGDRRGYQMDPANADEAIREVLADLEEGADIVMVKPALAYLDVIRRVKEETGAPVAAYHVSGEYAAIMAAIERGWLDERAMEEALLSIRRAGADIIVSYWAREYARRLGRG
ncbi:MAG: porphobilinogen synthase [Gemmatimonadota bacterium]